MVPRLRSFTISTERIGPRRWCWVRIHPNVEHLRRAAQRTAPWHGPGWFSECCGCFQPVPVRVDEKTGRKKPHPNGFAGTLRLAEGWASSEIVAHELMHAACTVFRMNVKADIRAG